LSLLLLLLLLRDLHKFTVSMGESAGCAEAALALSETMAEFSLVHAIHVTEFVVAMSEVAVHLVALLAEEIEAKFGLPQIWCCRELISRVSKAAGCAKVAIALREHCAHPSLSESCLHSCRQRLPAVIG
jgi:hypothetical protein